MIIFYAYSLDETQPSGGGIPQPLPSLHLPNWIFVIFSLAIVANSFWAFVSVSARRMAGFQQSATVATLLGVQRCMREHQGVLGVKYEAFRERYRKIQANMARFDEHPPAWYDLRRRLHQAGVSVLQNRAALQLFEEIKFTAMQQAFPSENTPTSSPTLATDTLAHTVLPTIPHHGGLQGMDVADMEKGFVSEFHVPELHVQAGHAADMRAIEEVL